MRTRILHRIVFPTCLVVTLAGGVTLATSAAKAEPGRPESASDSLAPATVSCSVEGVITFKPPISKTKQKVTATIKNGTGKVADCKSKNGAPEGFTGGTVTGSASADATCTLDIHNLAVSGSITWSNNKGVSKFKVGADVSDSNGNESDGTGTGTISEGPFKDAGLRGSISDAGPEVSDCFYDGKAISETKITKGQLVITPKS